MKTVLLLGASGCIGKKAISVLKDHKDDFSLIGVSVGTQSNLIETYLKEFPTIRYVYCIDEAKANEYKEKYPYLHVYTSDVGLDRLTRHADYDILINALSDFTGLESTLDAIYKDKDILLANKESIVVGYDLIKESLKISKSRIYTIDSEHSGIVRALKDESENIDKVYLTCSGGPFFGYTDTQKDAASIQEALYHPSTEMGKLISIESALYLNKAFEIVEANFFFDLPLDKIEVLLDSKAEYHSLIKYQDGHYRTYKKEMDMKDPLLYALYNYQGDDETITLSSLEDRLIPMSKDDYPVLKYADLILEKRGLTGAIINASASKAISLYLEGKIKFSEITSFIDSSLECFENNKPTPTFEDLKKIDNDVRNYVSSLIEENGKS